MAENTTADYQVTFIESLDDVSAKEWDEVAGTDYPFIKHGFLSALESTGVVTRKTGWQPQHLLVRQQGELVAFLPLYLKYHSYGEYVFDWSWAEAYQRHEVEYYPKLLSSVPYTPSMGPRLCVKTSEDFDVMAAFVIESLMAHAEASRVSSVHCLFPSESLCQQFQAKGLNTRLGTQFHWFNHEFKSFDQFLESFSSRKRKNVKKERKKVGTHNLTLRVHEGPEITPELWQHFYYFYQRTYLKRSGHGGYLNQAFFNAVAKEMPHQLVMVVAYEQETPIAAALNFRDNDTLYGRYWGCEKEYDFLHFEACYYQGIEYCIKHGLKRFDPGAQGEHKISRGFNPIKTWSNHWIAHPQFKTAIEGFLVEEQKGVLEYIHDCKQLLPFKAVSVAAGNEAVGSEAVGSEGEAQQMKRVDS